MTVRNKMMIVLSAIFQLYWDRLICCFCERLMITSNMWVRMTAMRDGLTDTSGNQTQACYAEVLHATH